MRGKNSKAVRTVVLPHHLEEPLLRALRDVASAVNQLLPDWRAHPQESRFEATKRTYRWVREHDGHFSSNWAVTIANETSATLASWDKMLRRARRHDPAKFARMKDRLPRRRNLKASLVRGLYRLDGKVLDITLAPDRHVRIDLSGTKNPLFWRYLEQSGGEFGLALTDRKLVFNFRLDRPQPVVAGSVGVDLNMPSVDYVRSDGIPGAVSLREISRVQGAMDRKRRAIQAALPTDLRAQRRVLRRYRARERNRVTPLLHPAANTFLKVAGKRNILFEDLSHTTEECLKDTPTDAQRRKLSAWTHGAFQRTVSYKAPCAVVRVNPRGSSSTCPRCGGPLAHPTWRRSDCGDCQGSWHRDWGAAIVLLDRGHRALRGAAPPPSARNALLEAATWRLGLPLRGTEALRTSTRKGDDGKPSRIGLTERSPVL
jgi:putative transposase